MARQKAIEVGQKKPKFRPALNPENREKQLISMAYDLAEERLRNGTATSQEIVHFLRLGSIREKKELEMIEKKNELMNAKTEALQSTKRIEELYSNAITAFAAYRGAPTEEYDEEELY